MDEPETVVMNIKKEDKTAIYARENSKLLSRPFPVSIRVAKGYSKLTYNHSTFRSIEKGLDVRESQLFRKSINVSKYDRERDLKVNFNGIISASGSIPGLEDFGGLSGTTGYKNEKSQKNTSNTCYCSINIFIEKCKIFINRDQVKLEDDIEKDIERIIDVNKGDKKKTIKSLVSYFDDEGYFVPMHIGLGGLIVIKYEVKEKEQLEEATRLLHAKLSAEVKEDAEKTLLDKIGIGKFLEKVIDKLDEEDDNKKKDKKDDDDDEKKDKKDDDDEKGMEGKTGAMAKFSTSKKTTNKSTDLLKNVSIEVRGGSSEYSNIDFKDISKWESSLHGNNYEVISAENNYPLDMFFSDNLKDKFEPFREEIKAEMNKPFEILDLYSNIPRFEQYEGKTIDGSVQRVYPIGKTEVIEGIIEEKTIPLNQEGSMFVKNEYTFMDSVNPNEVIVGFLIEATRNDSKNGSFTIETMNNKEFKLKFTSKRFRDQSWIIHVFYLTI